jgi:salicylate hydroxylase
MGSQGDRPDTASPAETNKPSRLHVIVCGGGIAGFATALLLREDHDVTVLESSQQNEELGAAITLSINASRLLRSSIERAGFDKVKAGYVEAEKVSEQSSEAGVDLPPTLENDLNYACCAPADSALQFQELHWKDLSVLLEWQISQVTEKYKEPWWYFSRKDIHGELKRAALSPDGLGPIPRLVLGAHVGSVDVESQTVVLASGERFHGDVIIGADGIRSASGNSVFGKLQTVPEGLSAYRCMIRSEKLKENPTTEILVDSTKVLMMIAPDRRIVAYPCSNWDWINFVCIFPDSTDRRLQWNDKVTVDEMVQKFQDFHPSIPAALSMASSTGMWQLRDRVPLSTLVKGCYAMIGDAAHAMGPRKSWSPTFPPVLTTCCNN